MALHQIEARVFRTPFVARIENVSAKGQRGILARQRVVEVPRDMWEGGIGRREENTVQELEREAREQVGRRRRNVLHAD